MPKKKKNTYEAARRSLAEQLLASASRVSPGGGGVTAPNTFFPPDFHRPSQLPEGLHRDLHIYKKKSLPKNYAVQLPRYDPIWRMPKHMTVVPERRNRRA